MGNKEKIAERIRKLLALAESSNQHEAELAMERANALMAEHQIAMSEVIVEDLHTSGVERGGRIQVSEVYRPFILDLADAVGTLFDCTALKVSGRSVIHFVGQKEDIESCVELFNYLFDSWKSIVKHDCAQWKQHVFEDWETVPQYEVKKYKVGHGQGFSYALQMRANDLARERRQQVTATGTDLIVLKDQLVQQWLDDKGVKSVRGFKQQHYGQTDGFEAGENIPLGGAIDEDKRRLT